VWDSLLTVAVVVVEEEVKVECRLQDLVLGGLREVRLRAGVRVLIYLMKREREFGALVGKGGRRLKRMRRWTRKVCVVAGVLYMF